MKFKQSIPLLNLTANRIPNANDDNTCGFGVGSIWEYAGVMYTCTNSSTGLAVWVNVGGGGVVTGTTDLSGIPTSTSTANTLVFFDSDKELVSATDILLGNLGITITKEFTLDFDGVEDTFEKTHNYYNDYITYSIRKADGSYYKETEYDVSSTTTTFTVVFVSAPASGTGKLTLQSVQNEAPSGGSGIGTGIIGSTFIVG